MLKKLNLISITLITLLLTGCGGGSSAKQENISDKKIILILKEVSNNACIGIASEFKNDTSVKNTVTQSTTSNISCANYGRVTNTLDDATTLANNNNLATCVESTLIDFLELEDVNRSIPDLSLLEDKAKSCVIGFDL
jgi:hypothetical protein